MLDENEFFRNITLKICGNLEIEAGLRDCIAYLSQHMPADYLCLEKYDEHLGAMRFVAGATIEKGERLDALVPLSGLAKAQMTRELQELMGNPKPVFVINDPEKDPITRDLLSGLGYPAASILGIPLIMEGHFIGDAILAAKGKDRFDDHHAQLFSTLRKPFFVAMSNTLKHRELVKLKDLLADDNRYLQGELRRLSGDEIIGANFGLKQVMRKVQQVAALDSPVLLMGETGTGKDVIANAIHYSSARSDGPFVSVNCGAIPDSLIDSELFGHEKGAFTGALAKKRGRFERADKGTIFLDEIGELPPAAQVRLLRVLQIREIERVGGVKTIPLNIRIIAATNRNLEEMVAQKCFREDLWFRLNVFPITIPPLRHRTSDIPALVQYFIERKANELKLSEIPELAAGVIDSLMAYEWPGNVRELENLVERALILHRGEPLQFEDVVSLPFTPASGTTSSTEENLLELDVLVKRHIQRALDISSGKIHGPGGAGERLGVNPNTLRYKMRKLGIPFRKHSSAHP